MKQTLQKVVCVERGEKEKRWGLKITSTEHPKKRWHINENLAPYHNNKAEEVIKLASVQPIKRNSSHLRR